MAWLALAAPGTAASQVAPAHIRWLPAAPLEGSVVAITLAPHPGGAAVYAAARGRLSGEPLHFERDPNGGFRALGPIPVGRRDSVPVEIELEDAEGVIEGVIGWVPVARRRVPVERIRTSPEFSRPPDSALAARIAAERERIRDVQRRTHERPRLWAQPFARPRGGRITSRFATRRVINGAEGGRHWGTDLDGRTGDPVRAANRGVVALVGSFFYGGCLVYLDHGAGLVTGYLHLSDILVSQGDTVPAGQLIGRVGATGRVTGPHLHWLANYGGVSVDPLGLLEIEPLAPLRPRVAAGAGDGIRAPEPPAAGAGTSGAGCRP